MPLIQSRMTRKSVTIVYALAQLCILMQATSSAKNTANTSAYLTIAQQATVNNAAAAKGLVVLSNSRIKTAPEGIAAINLGNIGQVAVGRSGDLLLQYSSANISGKLSSGRVAITAPAGVSISISTDHGTILSSSSKGTDVVIETEKGATRVVPINDSEISLSTNGSVKKLVAGEAAEIKTKGIEVKSSPKPTPAPAAAGSLSPEALVILISSLTTLGLGISQVVIQQQQKRDLRELLRRTNPSPNTTP